jgi:hypothetical protein
MTREDVEKLVTGNTAIVCPAAAIELLLGAWTGPDVDWRERCRRALLWLRRDVDLQPEQLAELAPRADGDTAAGVKRAVVDLVDVFFYGPLDREERIHVARLLGALCRAATKVRRRAEVA